MYTNRFFSLLVAVALAVVAILTAQDAIATSNVASDSLETLRMEKNWTADAARWTAMGEYYQNQAEAAEAEASTVDSATRSYIAQAKAVACGVDATYGPNLDSATRSYIAWGLAVQAKNGIGALCR